MNISFFIEKRIRSAVTSSRCGDEALLTKMYTTYICQYPVLAAKGWITFSNQTSSLFYTNMEKSSAFHCICKVVPALQHIPLYVQITKYFSPVAGNVFGTMGLPALDRYCPASRTTLVATRFRVAVICPIIQVSHCIRVFFYFVWFVFINHIFQFYYELCTYCNILDIYLS